MEIPHRSDKSSALFSMRTVAIIASLALGWVLIYVDRTILYPLLPIIGEEFELSGTQQGALASTYFIVYVSMQIPSGILADRLGLKRVLTGMYLVAGLGLVATGLLSFNYLALMFFIALHAFGAGAYYSCSYSITLSTVPPGKRGIASALVTTGMASGLAIGLALSGVLHELLDSWRAPFLVVSIPTVLLAFVFWLAMKTAPPMPTALRSFLHLGKDRHLLLLSAATFCLLYGQWVTLTWGPSFLFKERGLSLNQAGLYTAVVALPAIGGALLWGRLSDRIGRKHLLLLVAPFSAFAIFAVAYFDSLKLLLLFLALYGFTGPLSLNPVIVAWVGDLTAQSRHIGLATAIAVLNAIGVGSSVIAPVISGWMLDITGSLEPAFFVASGFAIVGILLFLLLRRGSEGKAARI